MPHRHHHRPISRHRTHLLQAEALKEIAAIEAARPYAHSLTALANVARLKLDSGEGHRRPVSPLSDHREGRAKGAIVLA